VGGASCPGPGVSGFGPIGFGAVSDAARSAPATGMRCWSSASLHAGGDAPLADESEDASLTGKSSGLARDGACQLGTRKLQGTRKPP
jgi:hypothetical protein